jgi:hypothetical protein
MIRSHSSFLCEVKSQEREELNLTRKKKRQGKVNRPAKMYESSLFISKPKAWMREKEDSGIYG